MSFIEDGWGVGTPEPIASLNRVPLRERGEPLVDLRKHCPQVRVSRKCIPFLRRTVADMLNQAQASLPPGYRFQVHTALRTLAIQIAHYEGYQKKLREEHPEWSYATLRRATNRFFAPPDQKAPPGHCTGAAVDVALILPGGRRADVSSPLTGWAAAPTFVAGLSARAAGYRRILYQAMMGAGFSNCRDEFWHYSYGDSAWAVRTGADHCFYGLVEPPATWTASIRRKEESRQAQVRLGATDAEQSQTRSNHDGTDDTDE